MTAEGKPEGWAGRDRNLWAESVLEAIDTKTGDVRWRHELGEGEDTAGILTTAGKLLFTADNADNLMALDPATGKTLWHVPVGGRMVALELETPYPADYHMTVQQVVRENETGYLPPLKTKIERMEEYDVVFLGFPTWDMQLPPPVKSFLHQYDLKGKTLIPFNTNGGYGPGSSFETVRELCPKNTILKGFTIRGGSERDGEYLAIKGARAEEARKNVSNWLAEIGMLN